MDHYKIISHLSLNVIMFCVIFLQPGHAQAITSISILPNPQTELNKFVFMRCQVEGFDVDQMVMSWKYNGRIFVDLVFGGDADFRSNINTIFGFEVNPTYLTAAMFLIDEDDQIFEGQMDVFVDTWMFNGDYECIICKNNGNGRCEEPPLDLLGEELNINYFPPDPYPLLETTSMQGGHFLAVVGSETMVSCYSFPGFPEVEIVLSKGTEVVDGQKMLDGDFLFYNYTFLPTASDNEVIFSCTIREGSNSSSNTLPALQLASTPEAEIMGPQMAGIGLTLVLECVYSSATSTPIDNYVWNASSLKSTYNENDDTLTIQSLQATDNGAVVTCTVTDSNGMTGVGLYTIVAVDPGDIPTTLSPSASSSETPSQSPVAIIVVVCIIGVLLLLLLVGSIFWWSRHHQKPQKIDQNSEKKPTTNTSVYKYDHHSDKNGPYTISSKVSNSPKPDIISGYYSDNKYREHDDYHKSVPVDDTDYRYPSYERSRSNERFYPQEDDKLGYHYNTGYDDEKQLYPQEFNDVEVGDFTQPLDRQPAYGQGYDDYTGGRGYNDPMGPEYDGYDDDYKPSLGYDDYGGSVDGYNDRYRSDEDAYRTDDGGYRFDGGLPYRSPQDDDLRNGYYPQEEDQFPAQGDYGDPNLPPQDDFFQNKGDMYPKDDPFNQYDYGPYGERDQHPDGQEADFQGDPYNDPYYPSSVDRMPDGGSPDDDPYFEYDIHPDAGEFGTSETAKHNSEISDQFDPSYV